MSKPLKKLATRRVTKEGIEELVYSNSQLADALNAVIDRINKLEAKLEHVHDVDLDQIGTVETSLPGYGGEGYEEVKDA